MSSTPETESFAHIIDERDQLRNAARDIFNFALEECSVENAFMRKVQMEGTELRLRVEGQEEIFDLAEFDRVRSVAAGKVAAPMLQSMLKRLSARPDLEITGVLATPETAIPEALRPLPPGIVHFPGTHPLPNAASLNAARAARTLLAKIATLDEAERTLCIFLISGGASAMLEESLDTTIPVEDVAQFHEALILCGASIAEINCVRKHFSAVKGGRLAQAAPAGSRLLALFVSDVPALQLDSLGSGPVLPDSTSVEQCFAVIEYYGLMEKFPASVQRFFKQPCLPETPKPGAFSLTACTLLDMQDMVQAARQRALQLGFRVAVDNSCDDWEYMAAARYLLERLDAMRTPLPDAEAAPAPEPKHVCLISGGEVTVQVESPAGCGGRNQQFALYAATEIARRAVQTEDRNLIVLLSAGSDGIDGNSSAAGAIADSETLARVEALNLNAEQALTGYDAFPMFDALGDCVVTGSTGNNLRDLRILLTRQKQPLPVALPPTASKKTSSRKPRMKAPPKGKSLF